MTSRIRVSSGWSSDVAQVISAGPDVDVPVAIGDVAAAALRIELHDATHGLAQGDLDPIIAVPSRAEALRAAARVSTR